jgi:hypothetical protein
MAQAMPPSAQQLFGLMAMSLLAWSIIAWVHVLPWLARMSRREALLFVVMPHMFRHVGALALYPGIGAAPAAWSVPLAWGDGITALLAAATMIALHRSWRWAIGLTWFFNVFGTLDLLHNGWNAAVLQVAPHLGVIAYIVAFAVPGMLVCHLLVFRTLLRSA